MEQEKKPIAEYLGYEDGVMTLKVNPRLLINAYMFTALASPAIANADVYGETLAVLFDLRKIAETELLKTEESKEEPATDSIENTSSKESIKAEVVEPSA